ncbi:adenylate kinase [Diplonema papillatum]|nr:adenylate kinase [Diplonema papillatum]KAJ9453829.1 adenylate kinase [Diplonema papillatum]
MPLDTYRDPPHIAKRFNTTRFEDETRRLDETETSLRDTTVRDRRDRLRESAAQAREGNAAWEKDGRRAHAANMRVFKEARARDVALALEIEQKKKAARDAARAAARGTVQSGIDEFEANRKRLGITDSAQQQQQQQTQAPQQQQQQQQPALPFDDASYINRIRQRKQEEVAGRKERTKRRHRMLLDQQNLYAAIYLQQQQDLLLEKIAKQGEDERALADELEKQAHWRHVMSANRMFREAQYEARRKIDDDETAKTTEHARERERQLFEMTRSQELLKVQELLGEKDQKKKEKRLAMCGGIAHQIVGLALKVCEHRERTDGFKASIFGGKPLVPQQTWRDWLVQFTSGSDDVDAAEDLECDDDPVATPAAAPSPDPPAPAAPAGEGEAAADPAPAPSPPPTEEEVRDARRRGVLKLLVDDEVKAYINHDGGWAAPEKPPENAEFNGMLCTLLDSVVNVLFPRHEPFRRRDEDPFVVAVFVGKSLSGKSVVGKAAAAELDMVCADSKDILSAALASCVEDAQKLVAGLSPDTHEIVYDRVALAREVKANELEVGRPVSDEMLAKLVVNHIRYVKAQATRDGTSFSPKGIILSGFPATAAQFECLEKILTTYDPLVLRSPPRLALAPQWAAAMSSADFRVSLYGPADLAGADLAPPDNGQLQQQQALPPQAGDAVEGAESEAPAPQPLLPLTDDELALLQYGQQDETALDLVLSFDVTDAEVFNRYAGERLDPATGKKYHLTYDPPPDDVVNRMREVDRTVADSELIHEKLTAYRHNKKRVVRWLGRVAGAYAAVDAERPLDEVTADAVKALAAAIEARHRHEDKKRQRDELIASRRRAAAESPVDAGEGAPSPTAAANAAPPAKLRVPAKLAPAVAQTLHDQWQQVTSVFEAGVFSVFLELRRLRHESVARLVAEQADFQRYLERPSRRQAVVEAFQADFNAFDPEMRRDPDGKAELHLRSDALQAALWKETDAKKDACEQALAGYATTPWHAAFASAVQVQFALLVELEVTRFLFTKKLVQFYYGAVYCADTSKPAPPGQPGTLTTSNAAVSAVSSQALEESLPDLLGTNTEEPPPEKKTKGKDAKPEKRGSKMIKVEPSATPPPDPAQDEFTKVYKKALQWVADLEAATAAEFEQLTQARQAQADALEADPNAAPGTVESAAVLDREAKAEAAARGVWLREAELLRYRLRVLCGKCYAFTDEAAGAAADLHRHLKAALAGRRTAEMRAVAALLRGVRGAIERQLVLEHPLDLSGDTALAVDEAALLVAPENVPLRIAARGYPASPDPALRPPDGADLITGDVTKQTMLDIIGKFRSRAPAGVIEEADFVRLFLQVSAATALDPAHACWGDCDAETFRKSFAAFDHRSVGHVDWRLFTVALVFWSGGCAGNPLWVGAPTLLELARLRQELEAPCDETLGDVDERGGRLTRDAFMRATFWFEPAVSQTRAEQLKEVLWELFKEAPPPEPEKPSANVTPVKAGKDARPGSSSQKRVPAGAADTPSPPAAAEPPRIESVPARKLLLYLCADKQVLRGTQKAFTMVSTEDGYASQKDVHDIFHFSNYASTDSVLEESYAAENIRAVFNSILYRAGPDAHAEGKITFAQLCSWHVGRVMLNNAQSYAQRAVCFDAPGPAAAEAGST